MDSSLLNAVNANNGMIKVNAVNNEHEGKNRGDDKIAVLILKTSNNLHDHVNELKNLFSSSVFHTEVYQNEKSALVHETGKLSAENIDEIYMITSALEYAAKKWPSSSVVLVKDSSGSNVDRQAMSDKLRLALDKIDGFELCYLCKWLDQCQKYIDTSIDEEDVSGGSKFMWTQSPNGVQSIMFTPKGRDVVIRKQPMRNGKLFSVSKPMSVQLKEEILSGNIKAICTVPNLIDFDISLAKNNSEFMRLNQCQMPQISRNPAISGNTQTSENFINYFWFAIIVVLIIIVAWAVIKISPN